MTNSEKIELINELINKMADLFQKEIPRDVMETSEGTFIMYNAIKEFLYRIGSAMEIDVDTICTDMQKYKLLETDFSNKELN